MSNVIYEMIGRLFSRMQMRKLGGLLESAGMDYVPEAFAGFMVVSCSVAAIITYLLATTFSPLRSFIFKTASFISFDLTSSSSFFPSAFTILVSILASVGLILLVAYVILQLKADARRRKVEEVLPDFLSLASANVRAGMTIDQAMWYATKPEFGILSDEVSIVAKKTFGGVPFNQAIDYLVDRFNSKPVHRSVALIKQGLASGGKLADILEQTAEESRRMMILRKEISTSLLMYVIFIVFAGALGTPFLFAISAKLVTILEGVFATIPTTSPSSLAGASFQGNFVMPTKPTVSSADFFLFTILTSIMTAIFSALIIGVISKGSKKDGVPYIPFLLAASLIIFFLVSYMLEGFLSNIYI